MKRLLPRSLKGPIRRFSDYSRREGEFFELQGRSDIIHKALITLDFNGIAGDYAEFGCCGATTFGFASRAVGRSRHIHIPRKLWAFDSFAGLPPPEVSDDEHPRWIAGTMKTGVSEFHALCAKKKVKNYDVVPGFYRESLRDKPLTFFPPGSIAFAYVDCDIYSSSLDVLRFLLPRLQHGMIIAFDDYWCYSTTDLSGERRAFLEVLAVSPEWHFEPYVDYGWAGMSFVVEKRLKGVPPHSAGASVNGAS